MTSQLIIEIIGAVLGKMGIVFESIEELEAPASHGMKRYVIKTGESGLLIGAKGVNFSALNHVVKKMVSKKTGGEEVRFVLDVNDYNKKITRNRQYSLDLIFSLSAFFCACPVVSFALLLGVKSASVCERRFNLLVLDHSVIICTE